MQVGRGFRFQDYAILLGKQFANKQISEERYYWLADKLCEWDTWAQVIEKRNDLRAPQGQEKHDAPSSPQTSQISDQSFHLYQEIGPYLDISKILGQMPKAEETFKFNPPQPPSGE